MSQKVDIANGFAVTGAGTWLVGHAQPAASIGAPRNIPRRGWRVKDRALLDMVATDGEAHFADSTRPFLTHIPCAAEISAVSKKVLVSPVDSRKDAATVRIIPLSFRGAITVTVFNSGWVVMATAGRTARIQVQDGQTLAVRPNAVVAWTGNAPTGYCPKLRLRDIFLPRPPKNFLLDFHGPCVVWIEGNAEEYFLPGARQRQRRVV